jgi:hypothetical protein
VRNTHTHTHTDTDTRTRTHTHTQRYTHTHVHAHTHIYAYIHTHINTQTQDGSMIRLEAHALSEHACVFPSCSTHHMKTHQSCTASHIKTRRNFLQCTHAQHVITSTTQALSLQRQQQQRHCVKCDITNTPYASAETTSVTVWNAIRKRRRRPGCVTAVSIGMRKGMYTAGCAVSSGYASHTPFTPSHSARARLGLNTSHCTYHTAVW